jgi:pyruvate ferredoxin oxidoreductase alpha subunit
VRQVERGLVSAYGDDAAIVVVVLGSVHGAVQDVVEDLRREGRPVGAVGITVFRPFPVDQVRAAVEPARVVLVLDRTAAIGADVEAAVRHTDVRECRVVAGRIGAPLDHQTVEWLVRAARPPAAHAVATAPEHVDSAVALPFVA